LPPANPSGSISSRTRTPGSLGSALHQPMDLVLERIELRRPLRTPKRRGRSERSAERIVLRASPVRRTSSLIETPRNEMLPAQLGPAPHVQHALLPVSIAMTPTPRTPPPPPKGGQISTGEGGQFSTGADNRPLCPQIWAEICAVSALGRRSPGCRCKRLVGQRAAGRSVLLGGRRKRPRCIPAAGDLTGAVLRVGSEKSRLVSRIQRRWAGVVVPSCFGGRQSERRPGFVNAFSATASCACGRMAVGKAQLELDDRAHQRRRREEARDRLRRGRGAVAACSPVAWGVRFSANAG
jgi:hypothetical protein